MSTRRGLSYKAFCDAVDQLEADLRNLAEGPHGPYSLTTPFGSTYSIEEWAEDLSAIFKNDESWWRGLSDDIRDKWNKAVQDRPLSLDIYSQGFPSYERLRANNSGPIYAGRSWLKELLDKDRQALYEQNLTVKTYKQLSEAEEETLKTFETGNRKLRKNFAKFVRFQLQNAEDEQAKKQVLAALDACSRVYCLAEKGNMLQAVLDHYVPTSQSFMSRRIGDDQARAAFKQTMAQEGKTAKKKKLHDTVPGEEFVPRKRGRVPPVSALHHTSTATVTHSTDQDTDGYPPSEVEKASEVTDQELLNEVVRKYQGYIGRGVVNGEIKARDKLKSCFAYSKFDHLPKWRWLARSLLSLKPSNLPNPTILPATASHLEDLEELTGNIHGFDRHARPLTAPDFSSYNLYIRGEINLEGSPIH